VLIGLDDYESIGRLGTDRGSIDSREFDRFRNLFVRHEMYFFHMTLMSLVMDTCLLISVNRHHIESFADIKGENEYHTESTRTSPNVLRDIEKGGKFCHSYTVPLPKMTDYRFKAMT
jgi:hypothetical protein